MLENVSSIQSIDNFSLINQTVVKNVKNDILHYYSNLILSILIKYKEDIEKRVLTNYILCQKSQLLAVRILAIENLNTDAVNFDELKNL
jgi:glutaminyl-tRNA synthetase